MMLPLVTVDEAVDYLRIDESITQELDLLMLAATQIVADYIKRPDPEWTEQTAPPAIKVAILLQLGALFNDREGSGSGIPDAAKAILHRYRDPALA